MISIHILAPHIWVNPGETGLDINGQNKATNGVDDDGNGFVDDIRGWDFVDNDPDPMDDYFSWGWVSNDNYPSYFVRKCGHGTSMAGIIVAKNDNHRVKGTLTWNIKIMPLKVMNRVGKGKINNVIKAIKYASKKGVRVINLSLGGFKNNKELEEAINNSPALIVCASGSGELGKGGGNNDIFPNYPASLKGVHVITVGASNSRGELSSFSNYGAWSVDLIAPGEEVYSTRLGGGYDYYSGTSAATAQVAGIAGLIIDRCPFFLTKHSS